MAQYNPFYYQCTISIESPLKEQLIFHLDQMGFNGYLETDTGIEAFVDAEHFDSPQFWELITAVGLSAQCVAIQAFPYQNWNKLWEASFEPQVIDEQVRVRAPFHKPDTSYPYEVIIEPQMAFGTGHHATTRMMVQLMLVLYQMPSKVFDFGTGSGILAILAEKMGATQIFGNETQMDGLRNAENNIRHNQCHHVHLSQEDLNTFPPETETHDLILANINRNTILRSLPLLKTRLTGKGLMAVSGYLHREADQIDSAFYHQGFQKLSYRTEGQWAAGLFSLSQNNNETHAYTSAS